MEHTFASATILLLLITDPLGNIPIFVSSLRAVPPARRSRVILREVLIAFAILLDATVVRALLVPAIMRLLGSANWWAPKWMKAIYRKVGLDH